MSNPILGNESYQSWNERHRRYMSVLIAGEPEAIKGIVTEIEALQANKVLSFGERKTLEAALNLLQARKVSHLTVIQGGRP